MVNLYELQKKVQDSTATIKELYDYIFSEHLQDIFDELDKLRKEIEKLKSEISSISLKDSE